MAQRNPPEVILKQEKPNENGNPPNQNNGPPNQQQGGGGAAGGGGPPHPHQNQHQNHPFQRRPPRGRGNMFQGSYGPNQFHNQGPPMDVDRKDRKFRPRNMQGGPKNEGGPGPQGPMGPRNADDRIIDRLQALNGPTFDLQPLDMTEKKFAGRNRLYIGNLPAETTDEELNEMFKPFGETSETFINKEKNFGFIRLDYHANAEKAKRELDGTVRKGRMLKVRFAPNGATIKVRNLTQWVTNELLYAAFSVFGEIERCVIIVDDRGKTTGEGIVEYARKPGALSAIKKCSEECFFLTSSLRPVIVENYDQMDVTDGYPEKSLIKKNQDYHQAREVGPRFANANSFEFEYGTRWKHLYELYKQKESALKQEFKGEEDKLEAQMQFAKFENETEMLREQLRVREMDRERKKRDWEERERIVEEQRRRNEEQMRIQQEEMQMRIHSQEEDIRRRQQENTLFMQAHQLSNMLDQQEQVIQSYNSPMDNNMDYEQGRPDGPQILDPKSFMNSYERSHRYEGRVMGDGQGMPPRGSGRAHWGNDGRRDDYQNKRRRY